PAATRSCAGRACSKASGASIRTRRWAPARRKRSTASAPPIRTSTTTRSCAPTWSDGYHESAALFARGVEPPRADRGMVPVRQVRRGAEIRDALTVRYGPSPARAELPLAGEHRGHFDRDLRRLSARRGLRHWRGVTVLLVAPAGDGGHAAARQPQHDPEGGARAAHHRLVQVRHRPARSDGLCY